MPGLRVAKGKARLVKADKAADSRFSRSRRRGGRPRPACGPDALGADTGVVALFYAGTADLAVVPGETGSAATLVAPLQPGAAGGPVFDRAGRLAGLIGAMPEAPRRVASIGSPARYGLVPAAELTKFLEGAGATLAAAPSGPDRTAGEIAAAAGVGVVPIERALRPPHRKVVPPRLLPLR